MALTLHPRSMNSAASQSSSAWLSGLSPMVPKSLGVRTRPSPIRNCQMRFAITRAVSGFSRDASQLANALRRNFVAGAENVRNGGLDRVEAVMRIAHPQDITLRSGFAGVDVGVRVT